VIKTSKQLKDKVRNLSGSDSLKAQTLIRNFVMERFLERIALSPYRNNFVLKGGMLVAAVIGIDMRDFYDIHIILHQEQIDSDVLRKAFLVTSQKRKSQLLIPQFGLTLDAVEKSEAMQKDWENYKRDAFFVGERSWSDVMKSVWLLAEKVLEQPQ
jgi:hypothetical protein